MAQPISLEIPPRDPRIDLQQRLEHAPLAHAEALLELYDIAQGLHDRGALDMARSAIDSSDHILEILVDAAKKPQSMRGLRNLLLMVNLLGEIDPYVLKAFTQAVPIAMQKAATQPDKPGLWQLVKDFLWNQNFRHGMAVVNKILESIGQSLRQSRAVHETDGNPKA